MASKREIPTASVPTAGGSKLLRIFSLMVFLAAVAGCLLAWPVSENQQLASRTARAALYGSARIARSTQVNRLVRVYGRLASLKVAVAHDTSAASVVLDCRKAPADVTATLLKKPDNTKGGSVIPAASCLALPPALQSPETSLKRLAVQPGAYQQQPAAQSQPATSTAASNPDISVMKPQGPMKLESLRDRATCNQGTSLNIVAHEDDDLLFMNPDIQTDISGGRCVRTVYVTAGDSGQAADYWSSREKGSKAAYAAMYHVDNVWHDQRQLLDGKLVNVSYLQDVPQVSLIFLQLPDGNLFGDGFAATANESVQKLLTDPAALIHTVTDETAYTKDDIVTALYSIMLADSPQLIRTLNPEGSAKGDHADHTATAQLAEAAADEYTAQHTVLQYAGYPDKQLETNLSADEITAKQAVFLAYAPYDDAVCQTAEACAQTLTYGNYLTRQYRIVEAAVSGQ